MAELSTLARPYAKAAFNAALDSKQLDAWSTQLSTLAAISQHETVERLIANPELSAADKAKTLQQLAGDALNEGGSNLVSVLAENRRLALLAEISEQFEVLKAEQENRRCSGDQCIFLERQPAKDAGRQTDRQIQPPGAVDRRNRQVITGRCGDQVR